MATDMRKTPSYLKGLAETRARSAGDLLRYQKIYDEIGQKMAEARAELEACDRLIRKFDERLAPERIEPIRAWKGRYGQRGALTEAIKRLLQSSAPNEMTTAEIAWALQVEFGLDFVGWQDQFAWQKNTVARALKKLVAENFVERLHELSLSGGRPLAFEVGWRPFAGPLAGAGCGSGCISSTVR